MGMFRITGGVAGAPDIHHAGGVALALLAHHVALTLLRIDVVDEAATGLEVVRHLVGIILVLALFEDGLALDLARGVGTSESVHRAGIQRHVDLFGRQLHVLIVHLAVAVEPGPRIFVIESDGVLGRIDHRFVQGALALLLHRVGRQSVRRQRVRHERVRRSGSDGVQSVPHLREHGLHALVVRIGRQRRLMQQSISRQGRFMRQRVGRLIRHRSRFDAGCRHHDHEGGKQQEYDDTGLFHVYVARSCACAQ